jgi:hypothetical protein
VKTEARKNCQGGKATLYILTDIDIPFVRMVLGIANISSMDAWTFLEKLKKDKQDYIKQRK